MLGAGTESRGWVVVAGSVLALSLTGAPAQARTSRTKSCPTGTIRMFKRGGRHPKLYAPKSAKQRPPRKVRVVCLAPPKVNPGRAFAASSIGGAAGGALSFKLPQALQRKLKTPLSRLEKNLKRRLARLFAPAKAAAARASDGQIGSAQNLDNSVHNAAGTVSSTGTLSVYADRCPDASGLVHGTGALDMSIRGAVRNGAAVASTTTVNAPFTVQVGDDGKPNHMTMHFQVQQRTKVTDGKGKPAGAGSAHYAAAATVSFPMPASPSSVQVSDISTVVEGSGTTAGLRSLVSDEVSGMISGANSAIEKAERTAEQSHDCQRYTVQLDSQIDTVPSGSSPFTGGFHYGYAAKAQLSTPADGSSPTGSGPGSFTATAGSMATTTAGGPVIWSINSGTGAQMLVTAFNALAPTVTLSIGAPTEQYTLAGPGVGTSISSAFFAFALDMLEGATPSSPLITLALQPGPVTSAWGVGVVAQTTLSHAGDLGAPIGAPVPLAGTEHTTVTVSATRKARTAGTG